MPASASGTKKTLQTWTSMPNQVSLLIPWN